ncbi:MAG TPA: DUF899 family protein [Labilithrix sp.]|jgi:predicted dithiol-disulfide oxidoreductase (DUF899 family)
MSLHDNRFPGETPAWRAARDELLAAERDLRTRVEAVAALRRKMPMGVRLPTDYVFEGESGPVKLSELFAPGKDTLVLYNFMFGPKMKDACPMCTSFLDGLNGNAHHLEQRVNLAVVARSPYARVKDFARGRGWKMRMLSSAENDFNRDFHGESADGAQNTIMHVFVKRADGVHHFYSTELNMTTAEQGQNDRHIDLMWSLWNVLDLTPDGRGADWYPKVSYAKT